MTVINTMIAQASLMELNKRCLRYQRTEYGLGSRAKPGEAFATEFVEWDSDKFVVYTTSQQPICYIYTMRGCPPVDNCIDQSQAERASQIAH